MTMEEIVRGESQNVEFKVMLPKRCGKIHQNYRGPVMIR